MIRAKVDSSTVLLPRNVKGGIVRLVVSNETRHLIELTLLRLLGDEPGGQLIRDSREIVLTRFGWSVGTELNGGQRVGITTKLDPGSYGVVARYYDGRQLMRVFETRGDSEGASPSPNATLVIDGSSSRVEPSHPKPGGQQIELKNVGPNKGKGSFELFRSGANRSELSVVASGLKPGQSVFFDIALAPGSYNFYVEDQGDLEPPLQVPLH